MSLWPIHSVVGVQHLVFHTVHISQVCSLTLASSGLHPINYLTPSLQIAISLDYSSILVVRD